MDSRDLLVEDLQAMGRFLVGAMFSAPWCGFRPWYLGFARERIICYIIQLYIDICHVTMSPIMVWIQTTVGGPHFFFVYVVWGSTINTATTLEMLTSVMKIAFWLLYLSSSCLQDSGPTGPSKVLAGVASGLQVPLCVRILTQPIG